LTGANASQLAGHACINEVRDATGLCTAMTHDGDLCPTVYKGFHLFDKKKEAEAELG